MHIILNFLKTSKRLFLKRKFFFAVILSCLAVGFSAFISLYDFISFENSYDQFHENADRIYRVQLKRTYPDRIDLSAGVSAGVGPVMKETFSEVEGYVKLWNTSHLRNILQQGTLSQEADKLFFASEEFFKVFSFNLLEGDAATALQKPNTAVITESLAKKIFGETSALGKTIVFHNPWEATSLEITGVAVDPPENSHIKYDMLVSFATLEGFNSSAKDSFGWSAFNTYLLMRQPDLPNDFESRVSEFISTNFQGLIERGVQVDLIFQPLSEVHLGPEMRFQPEPGGSAEVLATLSIAAIFILLLAWLNYINLSTANVSDRALEVGIRKVSGASQRDLIFQFLSEAFILNMLAMMLSLMIVELSHGQLTALVGKQIPGDVYMRKDIWILATGLVIGGTLLSGIYPAIAFASFKPTSALKGVKTGSKYFTLRKALVIFQLLVSFILISGTIVIFNQIRFMQQKNLGVNLDQVLVVKGPGLLDSTWIDKLNFYKQEVSGQSGISQVANTTSIPGMEITWVNNDVRWLGNPDDNRYSLPFNGVSAEYLPIMDLKILAGRAFIQGKEGEENNIILTEGAAKVLGFENPEVAIGEKVSDSNTEFAVVGVCTDFHQQSLNKPISPVIFRYVSNANNYLVIKLKTNLLDKTLASLENDWSKVFLGNPFDYFFLDSFFDKQYTSDQRFVSIFGIFTTIGLFIGGLGLLALSLFIVRRRETEVSIRKIMGATDLQIAQLFTTEISLILGTAVIFAAPASWYLSQLLLQNYAYKIPFQWSWIILPLVILLAILVVTSGWRIIKISRKNPVETIREN